METQAKETLLVLELKPLVPYKTKDEYMYAMKEDLAEWFTCLYKISINVENFFEILDTGVILCEHANKVRIFANEQSKKGLNGEMQSNFVRGLKIPQYEVQYRIDVKPQSFQARDNISNFITWTRHLGIPDVLSFETDDLVLRKNEKSVILCLLEVARVGAKLGMLAPTIVRMEEEIDAEIAGEPAPQIKTCDPKSLHEMVQDLAGRCTCPVQFSIIKVGEGKYKIGESQTLVFVRILRKHVMIRVGGGWDTLEHYLDKHDPCRCNFTGHRGPSGQQKSIAARRASTPTVSQSQPLSMKSPRKMSSASPAVTQRPPSPARMRSASPAPSPRKSSNQNFDQVKKKSISENENFNEKPRTISSRSQSPVPGRFRSPSPVPGVIKSDKVEQVVVHNNRPSSPIKQRRLSENVTVKRCISPSPANKRCVSESPAPIRKFGNPPQQRCGSVSPAPVRKTGLSTIRATKSIDQTGQLSKGQGAMDSSGQDDVSMDSISTMTLDEFKNLLNNALSVPNGDASEGSSPRSQSSTDSYKPASQNARSRGNKKTSANGGLLNKTWTAKKDLSKSFDTGESKTEKSWRSYTTREMSKTQVDKSDDSVTIPRPKTPVSLSKTKPAVTSYKPAIGPKPAVSSLKQNSANSALVSSKQPVNVGYTRPKTPTSLFNSGNTGNSVTYKHTKESVVSPQNSIVSPSPLSSPVSPSSSGYSSKLGQTITSEPRTPESERSALSSRSDTSSRYSRQDSKDRDYGLVNQPVRTRESERTVVSPNSEQSSGFSRKDSYDRDYSVKSHSSNSVGDKPTTFSRKPEDNIVNSIPSGSNGIVRPTEHNRPNVCYVTIKKGERNGHSFLAHIDTQVSRSIDYGDSATDSTISDRKTDSVKHLDTNSYRNTSDIQPNRSVNSENDSVKSSKDSSIIQDRQYRSVNTAGKDEKLNASKAEEFSDKSHESEVVIPRPSTPSLIPRPSTPSLIPRPSTPSLLPRPSTPVSMPVDTTKKPQKQLSEQDKVGRPPTPRKATIIAKSPSASSNSQKKTSNSSYANIYMNRRAMTPGPKDVNLVTAGDNLKDLTRRCITPGPNERYNRPSTPKVPTSRDNSNLKGNNEMYQKVSRENSRESVELRSREIPLSDYNEGSRKLTGTSESRTVPSSPVVERRRSSASSGETRSLKRQKAVDDNTVITVNRSSGQHAISVVEGNEVKYKTGVKSGARIIARSPSASQGQKVNSDRSRDRSRSVDVAQQQRQRPKSVEPQSFFGRRDSNAQGEEVLTVVRKQNGGHVVSSRTEAWVASTAEVSTPKKPLRLKPRSKTPSLTRMDENELQSRPLEEIKAALSLPINGLNTVDPEELEAPPEDPEAYAKMEQLFEALREKELKSSVNEIDGSCDIDIDCIENEDTDLYNGANLDVNENIKPRYSNSSRGSSVRPSPSSSNRGSVPSTPTRCKTPTLSRSSSSSHPIARPVSTPPRPSTPTRSFNVRKSSTKNDKEATPPPRKCKTPTDHASVLVSKIKQILNTKPRKDKPDGPKSRIPAPKSLSQASRSRSFSNLSSGSDSDSFRQHSLDSSYMNGNNNVDDDDELAMINSRTAYNSSNDNNRSQTKTPVPKLSNPLTTGRKSFLNNGRENTGARTPKLVRAVSSELLSSLSSSSQTLHTLDDEEYV